jgi:hypothetical protein
LSIALAKAPLRLGPGQGRPSTSHGCAARPATGSAPGSKQYQVAEKARQRCHQQGPLRSHEYHLCLLSHLGRASSRAARRALLWMTGSRSSG